MNYKLCANRADLPGSMIKRCGSLLFSLPTTVWQLFLSAPCPLWHQTMIAADRHSHFTLRTPWKVCVMGRSPRRPCSVKCEFGSLLTLPDMVTLLPFGATVACSMVYFTGPAFVISWPLPPTMHPAVL
eukprot:6241998-Amphidinium_carterae.2